MSKPPNNVFIISRVDTTGAPHTCCRFAPNGTSTTSIKPASAWPNHLYDMVRRCAELGDLSPSASPKSHDPVLTICRIDMPRNIIRPKLRRIGKINERLKRL